MKKIVTVNNKQIDLNRFLTTLEGKPNNYTASIEVFNYAELGAIINALIGVVRVATESNIETVEPFDASKVLEIAQQLLPFAELELIDKLTEG